MLLCSVDKFSLADLRIIRSWINLYKRGVVPLTRNQQTKPTLGLNFLQSLKILNNDFYFSAYCYKNTTVGLYACYFSQPTSMGVRALSP